MSRVEIAKKARELAQFERFAEACGCAPLGPRTQPDPPAPDIVVGPPHHRIGIELTELHPSGLEKRGRESNEDAVIAEAKELYRKAGGSPAHVWLSWTRHSPISNRASLARRVCEIVQSHLPVGVEINEVGTGFEPLAKDLPITRIGIARASSHQASEWRDGDMHEVGACPPDEIQARITQEDVKVGRYTERYLSSWLVLVVGAAGPSTWGVLLESTLNAEFRSQYDRVFILEHDRGRCHELRLAAGGSTASSGRAAS